MPPALLHRRCTSHLFDVVYPLEGAQGTNYYWKNHSSVVANVLDAISENAIIPE